MAAPQRYKKVDIETALIEARGFVTIAAKNLGCNVKTVYTYLERYPDLKTVRDQQTDTVGDLVESTLLKLALGEVQAMDEDGQVYRKEPSITALIFLAKTKFASRGYTERHDVTSGGQPIRFVLEEAPPTDE